jgi:ribosome maturation factor RimP
MAMFKTPANKRGVWTEYDIIPFSNKEVTMSIKTKVNGENVWRTQIEAVADYRVQDDFNQTPRLIPPSSRIAVFAKADTGTAEVTAHLGILLEAVDE